MVNQEELANCRRRGHEVVHLIDGKWTQCRLCGTWLRELSVPEEQAAEPPEEEIDYFNRSLREKPSGPEEIDAEELAICRKRGHNLDGLDVAGTWRRCLSCHMWARSVAVTEERADDPLDEELDLPDQVDRIADREYRRAGKRKEAGPEIKPAVLPPELAGGEPRSIKQLKPGETGYIVFTDMVVNGNRECFIKAAARLTEQNGYFTLEVRRDENGYHIAMPPGFRIKYSPRDLNGIGVIPVASIISKVE